MTDRLVPPAGRELRYSAETFAVEAPAETGFEGLLIDSRGGLVIAAGRLGLGVQLDADGAAGLAVILSNLALRLEREASAEAEFDAATHAGGAA